MQRRRQLGEACRAGVLEGLADQPSIATRLVEQRRPRLDLAYPRRRFAHGLP
jgi:hypothetical protein